MGAGSGVGCVSRVAIGIVNLREVGLHLRPEIWVTANVSVLGSVERRTGVTEGIK